MHVAKEKGFSFEVVYEYESKKENNRKQSCAIKSKQFRITSELIFIDFIESQNRLWIVRLQEESLKWSINGGITIRFDTHDKG